MKYLSKLLSMLLVGAMLYSTGCTDYAEDIKDVDNRVDQEVATLTGALQKAVEDAQKANDALQAEIDALETQLAGVETELTGVKSELEQAKKDLADLQSKAATKEELAALEAKVATKTELAEQLAALQTELESQIGGVEARVKANEDAIAALQSFVNGFNGDLATAGYENFAEVLAALNTLKANYEQHLVDFDNYKAEAAKALADAVAELEAAYKAAIAELKAELVEKIETADALLQGQIDDLVEDLAAAVEDITELQADMIAVEGRLDAAETAITANADAIANAQEDIEDLKAADEALGKKIDETKAALEAALAEAVELLEASIEDLQGQIDETNDALATLTENFNTLRADYDKFVAEVNAKLDALTANVEGLLNRIQSVVYVPEYTDGKITVKNVTFGNDAASMVLCGYAKVQYDIYPAYAAEALATSYKEGMLSFNHEDLKTRAAHEFDILAVNYKGNGRVELEVLLHNFNLATENVAVSLVVNAPEGDKTASNLSSCYAQLYASDEVAYNVSMNLYDAEMQVINGKAYTEQMPYDAEAFIAEGGYSYRPFEGYSLGFVLSNDNTNTVWSYEALKAVYPKLPMPEYTGDHKDTITFERVEGKEFDPAGLKGIEEVANEPGINVSVNEKQYIGVSTAFGVSYNWNGYAVAADASFFICPSATQHVEFELATPYEFKWNYTADAAVDAARFGREGYEDKTYTRNGLKINVAELVKVSETELPVDVTLAEVLASEPISVDVNGVEVSSLANGQLTFNFDGFEWDKDYVVSATYGMKHIDEVFESVVTVKFHINTVGRPTDLITVALEDAQWMLTKNFEYQSETAAESLAPVSDVYADFLGEATAASFLKDIFVEKAFDSTNKANGVTEDNTKLAIINNGAAVKSIYNINDYAVIPEAINYVYDITTWFGQKVKITKTLNINLQPVEITLATESKKLVKDLQFYTDAESLAAIYEKVTNVDKTDFTADEYLFAIFADPKFRALRAQEDLANGVELASTKLVVAPKDGATAKAAYDYFDFDVTPESVVYKSTYTTWYGQVITINKTVNIDWNTYNYNRVKEFVYGSTGNYYSNALPYHINIPQQSTNLNQITISLDMDTAFDVVVEGTPGRLSAQQLAELGLTSKFMFSKMPVDYAGIYFQENSNRLIYHGYDLTAGVKAELTLTNSNGVKTVLPTNFDAGKEYDGYYVNQYNPVYNMTKEDFTIPVSKLSKVYTYYTDNYIQIEDVRGYELIAHGSLVEDNERKMTYNNAMWVDGDDTNGFAMNAQVENIYGLQITSRTITGIPDSIKDVLYFTSDGKLVFDNTNQIELTEPIILTIGVDYTHKWIEAGHVDYKVTIYKNY